MPKSFIAALVACGLASQAFAQSPEGSTSDSGDAAAPPRLVLPGTLTSPTTSGLDSENNGATGAPAASHASDTTSEEAPYSVEGEETLDPHAN
jgi:hypothetical protein